MSGFVIAADMLACLVMGLKENKCEKGSLCGLLPVVYGGFLSRIASTAPT